MAVHDFEALGTARTFVRAGYIWRGIASINRSPYSGPVYNLTVENDHTYTVNNTAVHNCYGAQWRSWGADYGSGGIDQLSAVIQSLRDDPWSRRHLVSAWNVNDLPKMALPPCHYSFQFVVSSGPVLNCLVNMRSADLALGVPFNIASYALLTHIVAKIVNMRPGELSLSMADCHIYENHVAGVEAMLARNPRQFPIFRFSDRVTGADLSIDRFAWEFDISDYIIEGYRPHPYVKLPMAV